MMYNTLKNIITRRFIRFTMAPGRLRKRHQLQIFTTLSIFISLTILIKFVGIFDNYMGSFIKKYDANELRKLLDKYRHVFPRYQDRRLDSNDRQRIIMQSNVRYENQFNYILKFSSGNSQANRKIAN